MRTLCLLAAVAAACAAPRDPMPPVLPLRERAALEDELLRRRLDVVVPRLMRREAIDAWVLIAREYDEDPVVETMLPATWFGARRRTILLFHDDGARVERLSVSRYAVGDLFEGAWDKDAQPDQWARLAELLVARDPARIAVDVSPDFALADGLSASQRDAFLAALPERLRARVVPAEPLAIGWLETRIPEEMELYPTLCRIAHRIIAEGFSSARIEPGVTTTADLEWWYRERLLDLGLDTWFHPAVSLQRAHDVEHSGAFADDPGEVTIERGDLLHVDFGLTYLGLNTDTQQHAYVLRDGERDAPAFLEDALALGNRAQDVLMGEFATGRSGNAILAAALERCRVEGVRATIYTHPLGYHGHGAGPPIGLWDQQDGVPGRGDYPLQPDTAHSIELMVTVAPPEWEGQELRIMLEEDAFFDGERVRFIDGRQTGLILVNP